MICGNSDVWERTYSVIVLPKTALTSLYTNYRIKLHNYV